jgi:hypothetical protein
MPEVYNSSPELYHLLKIYPNMWGKIAKSVKTSHIYWHQKRHKIELFSLIGRMIPVPLK